MNTSDVRTAKGEDRNGVVGSIVLAFARDPVARWTYSDPHQYLTNFPELVRAFGGRAFEHDSAHYVGEFWGGALWLPPGIQPDEAVLDPLIERTVDPRKLQIVSRIFQEMARYHPDEPHWYLPLIGVDPREQGRGCGAALLRYTLERVDRERRPAYLENTNPANAPLYERHGFEAVGTIQVEDAPPLVAMIRRSR